MDSGMDYVYRYVVNQFHIKKRFPVKEDRMKKLMKKLEDVYAAAAYAEAGEHETARELVMEEKRDQKREQATKRPRTQLRASGRD